MIKLSEQLAPTIAVIIYKIMPAVKTMTSTFDEHGSDKKEAHIEHENTCAICNETAAVKF